MLTVCLFVLLAGLWAPPVTGHGHSCYDNVTSCQMHLQERLIDTDKYWFGTSFAQKCAGASPFEPGCINPGGPTRMSVLSRLLNMVDATDQATLKQKSQAVALVNVTFNAPEGHVYACGHTYTVPAVTDHMIDPLHLTAVSSWSLSYTPRIMWDAETPNTLYTVLVWDVGVYYLHGLYINCVNGTVDTGVPIDPYHEPKNLFLRTNSYIFAVYKQTAFMDVGAVGQTVGSILAQNNFLFQPWTFTTTFSNSMQDSPVFVNLLDVVADMYAMQQQKDNYLFNNCPHLISQMPAFHTVIMVTNVTAMWSDNDTSSSLEMMNTPYLTSLNINIDVEYSTDDYSVESCCSQYSITRGKFHPDPFSSVAERPGMTRNTPRVFLSPMNIIAGRDPITRDMYTLFLLDVAPALEPDAMNPSFITHWMVTNIKYADVTKGNELAPYFGPNPFSPNAPRAYMFLLYKQKSKVNDSMLAEFCPNGYQRCRLQLKPLLEAWDLDELVGVTWFLAEQDGFARQRIYRVLKAQTKPRVCNRINGYDDPCPAACTNSATSWTPNKLCFSLAVLLFASLFKNFGIL